MNKILKLQMIIVLAGLSSCVRTIDINYGNGASQLVVDGMVIYNPNDTLKTIPDTVRLSKSVDYLDNTSKPVVEDAFMTITANTGLIDTLVHVGKGKYITQKLRPRIGGVYKLNLVLSTGERYEATSYINRLVDFRSLRAVDTIRTVGPVGPVPAGGFVVLDAWDKAGQGDRGQGDSYRFKFFVKRKSNLNNPYFKRNPTTDWYYFAKPDNLILASESAGGGNENDIEAAAPFSLPVQLAVMGVEDELLEDKPIYFPGDSIKVQIFSITREHLFFYNRLKREVQNGAGGGFSGLFATPVANLPTNITPLNTDKTALGWFGAVSVSEKTVEMIEY